MNAVQVSLRNRSLILSLIPACSVAIDYALTFILAGSEGMILQWEASPLVRYALAHNLMGGYLAAIALFYYLAALLVLISLEKTPFYRIGAALILLISITHVLGGISWYFRTSLYSHFVMALSYSAILIAFLALAYAISCRRSAQAACTETAD